MLDQLLKCRANASYRHSMRRHRAETTPDLAQAGELASRFAALVRGAPDPRNGTALDAWLADARGTALGAFARGVELAETQGVCGWDRDAVRAALVEPWSTSPVEGQVNRLKLLKRAMHGRASYDLLRRRVLAAA